MFLYSSSFYHYSCGNTSITVPCGREKKTKPPKCQRPCKIPSRCHHLNEHKCHSGECPPCLEKCLLENDCKHPCTARCHDAIKVHILDKNFKPAGPWDIQPEKFEIRKLPHPKCEENVSVECAGGHEIVNWPCWDAKSNMSCGRACGRSLKCGNHVCQRNCHTVDDKTSMMQDNSCMECMDKCKLPRASECIHPCEKSCHPEPCEPCTIVIKTACHCNLTQVYYKCTDLSKENREALFSCKNRCIKNFSCGHRCTNTCHSGICQNEELCRKKLKIFCDCKNRKVETTCEKIRAGFVLICDEACTIRQNELKCIAEQQERIKRKYDEDKNRQDLAEFERKFGKRKHKERKHRTAEAPENSSTLRWTGFALAIAILAIFTCLLYPQ